MRRVVSRSLVACVVIILFLVSPSRAFAPVAVLVAVGSPEALTALIGVAAAANMITPQQKKNLEENLRIKIDAIKTESQRLADEAVTSSTQAFNAASAWITGRAPICSDTNGVILERRVPKLREETNPEGYIVNHNKVHDYRDPNCNGLFSKCCETLNKKADNERKSRDEWIQHSQSSEGQAASIAEAKKTRDKFSWEIAGPNGTRCCLNFDSINMALEIFSGEGKHLGERRCSDVTNGDLCQPTNGARAAEAMHLPVESFHTGPQGHLPRGGCAK